VNTYPRTITNGGGEELTFLGIVRDADGERMEVEGRAQPGAGPPMHIHHLQDESLTVVEGRVGYQGVGSEPQFAGPGETVTFLRGVPHRWWNAGSTELHVTGVVKPPLNFEYFLTGIFESMAGNGGQRPNPFDGAFLTHHYQSEFAMLAIPAPVQKIVFPILRVIGGVLGKYKKYADAPPPVGQ
jgi:quercetin dioxygenase-like cupin family protein